MTSGQPSVLVVEDDPSVARMLRISLRQAGFAVIHVTTGGEALVQLQHAQPDAVVLDLGLPDDRAGDVLAKLRGREDARHPAWLVVTAQDRDDVTKRYGQLGSHFISKPFDPWGLVEALQLQLA